MASLLSARGIDRRFGGASALTAAHFDLAAGEVRGLKQKGAFVFFV
jgi:ABC-type sugar transport system ATPase subunit